MPDEINPMRDMGFIHDKQTIVEPEGFLTDCRSTRMLCERYIPDGGKFYDLLDRYDNVTSYVLNRDDTGHSGDVARLVCPFLKAFGATDYEVYKFYRENLVPAKGAADVMGYFMDLMPTFIDTSMFEHASDVLCDEIGIPRGIASSTALELDDTEIPKKECRELRALAKTITDLKMPTAKYEMNVPVEMDPVEVKMVETLDDVFTRKLGGTAAADMIMNMASVGANEKAYTLLDIRKSTQVDLDGTVYIGGDVIDYQAMDLVKDGNGLSLAFNGSEFAVHGSNVAVLSRDCTAAAVLVAEFYSTGIEGVFELVDNWSRDYLKTADCPDRSLMDRMLANNPRSLPKVYRVTRDNAGEVAAESDAYRRRLLGKKKSPKKAKA